MKKILIPAFIVFLAVGFSYAEEQAQDGFWYTLLKKVNTISTRGPGGKTHTSVVGVRGAEDTSDELYWKGEAQKGQTTEVIVPENELSDFRQAVDQASQGERQQALASFKTFIATYPDSELAPDAKNAIHQLETEGATIQ